MKIKLSLIISLLAVSGALKAQILQPISWGYHAQRTSSTEATLSIRATLDRGWHLYSQHIKPGGPTKTIIKFVPSKDYDRVGATIEPKPIVYYDKNFKMDVGYFKEEVIFKQKIKLKKAAATVKVNVEFTVCNDKSCLPPDEVTLNIPIKKA